jgi:membrane-associated phospholipid phosphatase
MRPTALSLALGSIATCWAASAGAVPLNEQRSEEYYWLNTGLTVGGLVASAGVRLIVGDVKPGRGFGSFGPDDGVIFNFSDSAASLSDAMLIMTVTTPLLVQLTDGFDTPFANAALIYAEAQSANLLITTITKLAVRRPRPYLSSPWPRVREFAEREGTDKYLSFFSGHSSAAHTSATAGSILYSARTDALVARHVLWGVEFGLAGITAQLRVRAGRHYRTDIWAGALVGTGIGLGVTALNDVDLGRVEVSEWATGGGALVVTYLLSEAIDFCRLLGYVSLCSLDSDVRVPVRPTPETTFMLLPAAFPAGAGAELSGTF